MSPSQQCLALLLTAICCRQQLPAATRDYGKIMQAGIRRSLGNDFREYEWMSYPTNNFGLATMYVLENENDKPSDKNQWCATYTCLGLEGKRAPATPSARLTAGGYADVGTGGPIVFSDKESSVLASDVFLPEILNVVGLGTHLAATRNARVSIRMGNVSRRILKKQAILAYLETLPEKSAVRKALNESRLAMVVADAVIDSLEVDIDTDSGQSGDLSAALTPLLNRSMGGPATMQIQVKRDKSGQYRMLISQPVIIARLTLRRPLAGRDTVPGYRAAQLPAGLGEWETWVAAGAAQNVR
jgi:hypothetical protein